MKSSILADVSTVLADLAAIVKNSEVGEDAARLDSFVKGVLKNCDKHLGKAVIFFGRNSVGKSWILNLLMQMTLKPDALYEKNQKEGEAYAFFKQGGRDGLLAKEYAVTGNPFRHECQRGYCQEILSLRMEK
uniref:Uncharacterized protein n=1 Tax=Cryptomonas curvata TaxID=233186 RepID=A0A7S0LVB1_9CRYP|mmetsp:Transcript_12018/g.25837  ORF Transcript_12018/g.25837 Transcript_12018/m.25837 type:complete len:132 (+) Transcript_12018:476-871(+)